MRRNSKQIIGEQLKKLRKQYQLTARDIAIRCRIAHPNLLNIENGKQNVSLDTLEKLANAYGMEITLIEKQYGMQIEEKQIKLLRKIEKQGYLLSNKKSEDGNIIAYKPHYKVNYWYHDTADPEIIGEYKKVDKAIAELPVTGNSQTDEYYEPISELIVRFIKGYIDEDGDFIGSNTELAPSELEGCDIEMDDDPAGYYRHQSRGRMLDNAFFALTLGIEEYVLEKLDGETFYCRDENKPVVLNCKSYDHINHPHIDIVAKDEDGNDETKNSVKVEFNRNDKEFELVVKYGRTRVKETFDILDTTPLLIGKTIKENIENLLLNNI